MQHRPLLPLEGPVETPLAYAPVATKWKRAVIAVACGGCRKAKAKVCDFSFLILLYIDPDRASAMA
jgi:hypothetical protein